MRMKSRRMDRPGPLAGADGAPASPAIRQKIVRNQARAAAAWSETSLALTRANRIGIRERIADSRWQILTLAILAILLFFAGTAWTARNRDRDRRVTAEAAEGQRALYFPRTLNPGP